MLLGVKMSFYEDTSIEDGKYEAALDKWSSAQAEEFHNAVTDMLDGSCSVDFVKEMALSLADNYIQTGNCHFMDTYGLYESHALCFHNQETGNYVKEVESAFDESRSD